MVLHMVGAETPLTSDALAKAIHTNPVVVRRVLAGLREAGLVRSEKGHGGGWSLASAGATTTLYDVYVAIGLPSPFALGNRTESPGCLVEQAVNAALDDAFTKPRCCYLRGYARYRLQALRHIFKANTQCVITFKENVFMNHDAIVIGGSFAGLSAAIHIARARRSVCVVDAGLPRNRFAEAAHGFFGQDGMAPLMMIAQAREKLLAYPSVTFINGSVQSARACNSGGFEVRLASGELLAATKLVLAFGVSDILPAVPGLTERWGKTVLACPYCHGFEFGGRQLGVLSVSPLSAHQALIISDWGPTTFFLNGRNDLDETTRKKLAFREIAIEPVAVLAIKGAAEEPVQLLLSDGRSQRVEALYVGTQTRMNSSVAEQLGCAFDDGPFGPIIRTDAAKITTVVVCMLLAILRP